MCYLSVNNIQESTERENIEKHIISLFVCNSWLCISYLDT